MRLIDADALLKKAIPKNPEAQFRCVSVNDIINAPTIEAQQERTGRWLPDNNSVYEMRFICSECKESQVVPTIGFTKYKPIWDFCPNCGADMRGEQNGRFNQQTGCD